METFKDHNPLLMKQYLFFILLTFSVYCSGQEKKQDLKNLFNEYGVSVNHGIGTGFFGGGLGANHVFHPDKVVSFRTGLEFQFFHAWSDSESHPSHYSSTKNIHYSYVDLTVPIVMRLNVRWLFIELGGHVGAGISGQRRATVTNYSDFQPAVETTTKDSWNPGISAGLLFGIGTRIPLTEKLDLLIRPDVGASAYFQQDFLNLYGRLCVGIHLN
jgi:hypothetical protein